MKDKIRKYLLPNLPYLFFVYLFDKLCQAVRLAPGADASEKLLRIAQGFTEAFASLWISLHPLDLLLGVAGAALVRLAVYLKAKKREEISPRRGVRQCEMGPAGGYRALHRPRSRLEHPSDPDGKPHHDQPPEGSKNGEK